MDSNIFYNYKNGRRFQSSDITIRSGGMNKDFRNENKKRRHEESDKCKNKNDFKPLHSVSRHEFPSSPYDLLGLQGGKSNNVTESEIKAAFRKVSE